LLMSSELINVTAADDEWAHLALAIPAFIDVDQ